MLDGIRSLDFMEQTLALNQAAGNPDPADLPALRDLFLEPVGDAAVDKMVRSALRAVLLATPKLAVEGLAHDDPAYKNMCVNVLHEAPAPEAAARLADLAQSGLEPDFLADVLRALAATGDAGHIDVFRARVDDADPIIASLAIECVGHMGAAAALPMLKAVVEANEADDAYETCEVATWKAIEALTAIGGGDALQFLAEKLHHKNPTARRIIHESMAALGKNAEPYVAAQLDSNNRDQQIMAANVLGMIGCRKCADALVTALDEGKGVDGNVRFALFEALGRIAGMKSLVALFDGLETEDDEAVLTAIFTSLELHAKTVMADKLLGIFKEAESGPPKRRETLEKGLAAAGAVSLFELLFSDTGLVRSIIDRVALIGDTDVIDAFAAKLHNAADVELQRMAESLEFEVDAATTAAPLGRLLAVDDSDAMRKFYRTAGAEIGFAVTTAANGQEALDAMDDVAAAGEAFTLILVDMNMPVMDGIEFTTKARAREDGAIIPIVMASTESEKSQAVLAKKAGVSTFLNKPFTLTVLQNKISKILQ